LVINDVIDFLAGIGIAGSNDSGIAHPRLLTAGRENGSIGFIVG